jgi:hypothetical protein
MGDRARGRPSGNGPTPVVCHGPIATPAGVRVRLGSTRRYTLVGSARGVGSYELGPETAKAPPEQGFRQERMKGLEPSTFCMASAPCDAEPA